MFPALLHVKTLAAQDSAAGELSLGSAAGQVTITAPPSRISSKIRNRTACPKVAVAPGGSSPTPAATAGTSGLMCTRAQLGRGARWIEASSSRDLHHAPAEFTP